MAIAVRGFADPFAAESVEREAPSEDAQMVVVRPQVVETVGHVLGNVFQRMYHLIEACGDADTVTAAALHSTTRALEDFLRQVIDYFSPVSLVLQQLPAAEVAQSLARQLSDAIGGAVKLDAKLPADSCLLADPGRLACSFALLAARLHDAVGSAPGTTVRIVAEAHGRSVRLNVILPDSMGAPQSSESEVRWAVAEKFVETHGGTLRERVARSGEVLWEIVLPLQP